MYLAKSRRSRLLTSLVKFGGGFIIHVIHSLYLYNIQGSIDNKNLYKEQRKPTQIFPKTAEL